MVVALRCFQLFEIGTRNNINNILATNLLEQKWHLEGLNYLLLFYLLGNLLFFYIFYSLAGLNFGLLEVVTAPIFSFEATLMMIFLA